MFRRRVSLRYFRQATPSPSAPPRGSPGAAEAERDAWSRRLTEAKSDWVVAFACFSHMMAAAACGGKSNDWSRTKHVPCREHFNVLLSAALEERTGHALVLVEEAMLQHGEVPDEFAKTVFLAHARRRGDWEHALVTFSAFALGFDDGDAAAVSERTRGSVSDVASAGAGVTPSMLSLTLQSLSHGPSRLWSAALQAFVLATSSWAGNGGGARGTGSGSAATELSSVMARSRAAFNEVGTVFGTRAPLHFGVADGDRRLRRLTTTPASTSPGPTVGNEASAFRVGGETQSGIAPLANSEFEDATSQLIALLVRAGKFNEATRVFLECGQAAVLDAATLQLVVVSAERCGRWDVAASTASAAIRFRVVNDVAAGRLCCAALRAASAAAQHYRALEMFYQHSPRLAISADAFAAVARSAYELRHLDAVHSIFSWAATRLPHISAETCYLAMRAAEDAGRFDRQVFVFGELLSKGVSPSDLALWSLLAAKGNWAAALRTFEETRNPNALHACLVLGILADHAGRWEAAAAVVVAAVMSDTPQTKAEGGGRRLAGCFDTRNGFRKTVALPQRREDDAIVANRLLQPQHRATSADTQDLGVAVGAPEKKNPRMFSLSYEYALDCVASQPLISLALFHLAVAQRAVLSSRSFDQLMVVAEGRSDWKLALELAREVQRNDALDYETVAQLCFRMQRVAGGALSAVCPSSQSTSQCRDALRTPLGGANGAKVLKDAQPAEESDKNVSAVLENFIDELVQDFHAASCRRGVTAAAPLVGAALASSFPFPSRRNNSRLAESDNAAEDASEGVSRMSQSLWSVLSVALVLCISRRDYDAVAKLIHRVGGSPLSFVTFSAAPVHVMTSLAQAVSGGTWENGVTIFAALTQIGLRGGTLRDVGGSSGGGVSGSSPGSPSGTELWRRLPELLTYEGVSENPFPLAALASDGDAGPHRTTSDTYHCLPQVALTTAAANVMVQCLRRILDAGVWSVAMALIASPCVQQAVGDHYRGAIDIDTGLRVQYAFLCVAAGARAMAPVTLLPWLLRWERRCSGTAAGSDAELSASSSRDGTRAATASAPHRLLREDWLALMPKLAIVAASPLLAQWTLRHFTAVRTVPSSASGSPRPSSLSSSTSYSFASLLSRAVGDASTSSSSGSPPSHRTTARPVAQQRARAEQLPCADRWLREGPTGRTKVAASVPLPDASRPLAGFLSLEERRALYSLCWSALETSKDARDLLFRQLLDSPASLQPHHLSQWLRLRLGSFLGGAATAGVGLNETPSISSSGTTVLDEDLQAILAMSGRSKGVNSGDPSRCLVSYLFSALVGQRCTEIALLLLRLACAEGLTVAANDCIALLSQCHASEESFLLAIRLAARTHPEFFHGMKSLSVATEVCARNGFWRAALWFAAEEASIPISRVPLAVARNWVVALLSDPAIDDFSALPSQVSAVTAGAVSTNKSLAAERRDWDDAAEVPSALILVLVLTAAFPTITSPENNGTGDVPRSAVPLAMARFASHFVGRRVRRSFSSVAGQDFSQRSARQNFAFGTVSDATAAVVRLAFVASGGTTMVPPQRESNATHLRLLARQPTVAFKNRGTRFVLDSSAWLRALLWVKRYAHVVPMDQLCTASYTWPRGWSNVAVSRAESGALPQNSGVEASRGDLAAARVRFLLSLSPEFRPASMGDRRRLHLVTSAEATVLLPLLRPGFLDEALRVVADWSPEGRGSAENQDLRLAVARSRRSGELRNAAVLAAATLPATQSASEAAGGMLVERLRYVLQQFLVHSRASAEGTSPAATSCCGGDGDLASAFRTVVRRLCSHARWDFALELLALLHNSEVGSAEFGNESGIVQRDSTTLLDSSSPIAVPRRDGGSTMLSLVFALSGRVCTPSSLQQLGSPRDERADAVVRDVAQGLCGLFCALAIRDASKRQRAAPVPRASEASLPVCSWLAALEVALVDVARCAPAIHQMAEEFARVSPPLVECCEAIVAFAVTHRHTVSASPFAGSLAPLQLAPARFDIAQLRDSYGFALSNVGRHYDAFMQAQGALREARCDEPSTPEDQSGNVSTATRLRAQTTSLLSADALHVDACDFAVNIGVVAPFLLPWTTRSSSVSSLSSSVCSRARAFSMRWQHALRLLCLVLLNPPVVEADNGRSGALDTDAAIDLALGETLQRGDLRLAATWAAATALLGRCHADVRFRAVSRLPSAVVESFQSAAFGASWQLHRVFFDLSRSGRRPPPPPPDQEQEASRRQSLWIRALRVVTDVCSVNGGAISPVLVPPTTTALPRGFDLVDNILTAAFLGAPSQPFVLHVLLAVRHCQRVATFVSVSEFDAAESAAARNIHRSRETNPSALEAGSRLRRIDNASEDTSQRVALLDVLARAVADLSAPPYTSAAVGHAVSLVTQARALQLSPDLLLHLIRVSTHKAGGNRLLLERLVAHSLTPAARSTAATFWGLSLINRRTVVFACLAENAWHELLSLSDALAQIPELSRGEFPTAFAILAAACTPHRGNVERIVHIVVSIRGRRADEAPANGKELEMDASFSRDILAAPQSASEVLFDVYDVTRALAAEAAAISSAGARGVAAARARFDRTIAAVAQVLTRHGVGEAIVAALPGDHVGRLSGAASPADATPLPRHRPSTTITSLLQTAALERAWESALRWVSALAAFSASGRRADDAARISKTDAHGLGSTLCATAGWAIALRAASALRVEASGSEFLEFTRTLHRQLCFEALATLRTKHGQLRWELALRSLGSILVHDATLQHFPQKHIQEVLRHSVGNAAACRAVYERYRARYQRLEGTHLFLSMLRCARIHNDRSLAEIAMDDFVRCGQLAGNSSPDWGLSRVLPSTAPLAFAQFSQEANSLVWRAFARLPPRLNSAKGPTYVRLLREQGRITDMDELLATSWDRFHPSTSETAAGSR